MDIRPSPIAGSWYPNDPDELKGMITGFLEGAASFKPDGKIWGAVVPHAGYLYSGAVAARAFCSMRALRPGLIVLLGPYHDVHPAAFLTAGHAAYRTPFGIVELHQDHLRSLNARLRKVLGTGLTPVRSDREHSLEIQLPFLQALCGSFKLVPIMVRERDPTCIRVLGEQLSLILRGEEVLWVASSDLSHFYPQNRARQLDEGILHKLAAFDPEGILAAEAQGTGYACGASAIAACLWGTAGLGADRVTVTGYATSGDVNGDFSKVVGYGSALIWQASEGGG